MITLRDMPDASDALHDLSRVFAPAGRVPDVLSIRNWPGHHWTCGVTLDSVEGFGGALLVVGLAIGSATRFFRRQAK
jgi:hypothetical protein